MTHKYIKRKWTDHQQTIEYLSDEDEYIRFEVFSFDPVYTRRFSVKADTLIGENCNKVNFKSFKCYQSKDKINPMEFTLNYTAPENGLYRIDVLYEKKSDMYTNAEDKLYNTGKDLTGWYDIYKKGSKAEHKASTLTPVKITSKTPKSVKKAIEKSVKIANESKVSSPQSSVPLKFEGENNALKRKTLFKELDPGDWKFEFGVPHNCYVIGAIIRKVIRFWGTNNDEPGTNLQFTKADLPRTDMCKPCELTVNIGYDDSLECEYSKSGFYLQTMDECNLYAKTIEGEIKQVFGGYVSVPLADTEMKEITIHCSDRLRDGENRYILDQLLLQNGENSEKEYKESIKFNTYADALKYLCRTYEVTLKNNINKNFKTEVEKYQGNYIIKFGKKRDVKKVSVTNGKVTINKNSITLRNNSNSSKKQIFNIFNTKNPVNLSQYGDDTNPVNLHIHYGLGDVKTEYKKKKTIEVDVGGTTAGSQKFGKCGVSADKKYVMGIGQRTVGRSASTYPDGVYFEAIYENECPYCHKPTLRWDSCRSDTKCIFNHGRNGSKRNFPVPANETEFTCENCDCDFDVPTGYSKEGKYKYRLKRVGSVKKSSKARQDKLHKGEMEAVANSKEKVSPDDIFKAIKKTCKGWKHSTGTGSTASYLEKHHVGDCWAWSDWISKQLKKYHVNHKIVEYKSSGSNQHRSVLYQNSKGKYVDFPYRDYNFPSGTNNTAGSTKGREIYHYNVGGRINQATTSNKSTKTETKEITVTKGYDKETPFQAYLDICFTLGSKTGKKHHVYVDFTQQSKSDYSISGLKPVWINNASQVITVKNILKQIQDYYQSNKNVYLHNLKFIAPSVKAKQGEKNSQWYTDDENTDDNSSCKMILYSISFDNHNGTVPSDLQACGKSVNDVMKSLVEDAGYIVSMDYATHRCDDIINFKIDNQNTPKFTATEGDNNNILEWGNINYNPANEMFNISRCVFKQRNSELYAYVDTTDIDSILDFQEQCTLITENESIGEKEAYWNARHNEKFNPNPIFSYTITVFGCVDLDYKDLVEVISDFKQLNDLKETESNTLHYDIKSKPVLQTELGLGELPPDVQVRKTIKGLRDNTKKKSTYFYGTAQPVSDESVYEWEY